MQRLAGKTRKTGFFLASHALYWKRLTVRRSDNTPHREQHLQLVFEGKLSVLYTKPYLFLHLELWSFTEIALSAVNSVFQE